MNEYVSEAETKAMAALEIEASTEFLEALKKFRAANETTWVFDPEVEDVVGLVDAARDSNHAYMVVYLANTDRLFADFECDDEAIWTA